MFFSTCQKKQILLSKANSYITGLKILSRELSVYYSALYSLSEWLVTVCKEDEKGAKPISLKTNLKHYPSFYRLWMLCKKLEDPDKIY